MNQRLTDAVLRLIQECCELTKELTKAAIFGWGNHHPVEPGLLNYDRVLLEADDVEQALNEVRSQMATYEKRLRNEIK